MKRIRTSNSLLILGFVILLPIYPVFGAVLYDGTRRGGVENPIDTSSILAEYTDVTDEGFIGQETLPDAGKVRTIDNYVIQNGDTLGQIAEKFQISINTLKWANNLSSNTVRVGQKLVIPPGDGIIYTTKKGDTLDAIALKYKTTSEKIRNANLLGDILPVSTTIFLPDGQQPPLPVIADVIRAAESGVAYTLKVINPKGAGFVPGHCTYFVAKHWPVKWRGHARYWFKNANAAGFKTGQTALPGCLVWSWVQSILWTCRHSYECRYKSRHYGRKGYELCWSLESHYSG